MERLREHQILLTLALLTVLSGKRALGQGVQPQYWFMGASIEKAERGLRRVAYRVALRT